MLGFAGKRVRFESTLRKISSPIGRIAKVVDARNPGEFSNENLAGPTETPYKLKGNVRVQPGGGSLFVHESREFKRDKLSGVPDNCGKLAIPTTRLLDPNLGNPQNDQFESIVDG